MNSGSALFDSAHSIILFIVSSSDRYYLCKCCMFNEQIKWKHLLAKRLLKTKLLSIEGSKQRNAIE